MHLERDDRHVYVEEEIEIDMDDVELDCRSVDIGIAHAGDIAPAKDANARLTVRAPIPPYARAVQKTLHERQEGDEFLVVTLLRVIGIAFELVDDLLPGIVRADGAEPLPVPVDPAVSLLLLLWHELQRPQDELPQVPHDC